MKFARAKSGGGPSWVINGPAAFEIRLPFYPQERTFRNHHLFERQLCAKDRPVSVSEITVGPE
jgi:hypothetical protein